MKTIFDSMDVDGGVSGVNCILDFITELKCCVGPNTTIELSSNAMTGLAYVFMLASDALEAASKENSRLHDQLRIFQKSSCGSTKASLPVCGVACDEGFMSERALAGCCPPPGPEKTK